MISKIPLLVALSLPAVGHLAGCGGVSQITASTWHAKCGWQAEDYFDDPQVIALCKAIEKSDIAEIDRLVAAGANVNALGKENMTPLLWAYPDSKLERFKRLLEHGADPNIVVKSDFNTRRGIRPGDSVTHLACKTSFPGYFEVVFEHGGDPNLILNGHISNQTPILTLLSGSAPNKIEKVKLLASKGADLDHMDGGWATPLMMAVGRGGRFDIALVLLEAGANPMIYRPKSNGTVIHNIVEQERLSETWTREQKQDYEKLVEWLEDHGESIAEAKADMERWESWSLSTGEYRRKMDAEIRERKRREARKREQAANQEQPDP